MEESIESIARAFAAAGGRAILVGGWVRDQLRGEASKDLDFEVYGLEIDALERVLAGFGEVIRVGRAFGVLRVKGLDIDFSLPRRDSKTGAGHRGFLVELDPTLDFATAARRRDLTVNSIGFDPLTGEYLDPWGGREDLERRVLRATDAAHFSEDPLRGVRVAQFAARLECEPDEELCQLSAALDLSELPGERLYVEFRKLLLKGVRPSRGLEFLRDTRLLRFFPELEALVDCPQDPIWHPEGTVWEHTLLVVDEAALDRQGPEEDDLILMFGALCHDLGKPATTFEEGGRIRSPNHEEEGVEPTERFFDRLSAPHDLLKRVAAIVRHHLAPAQFVGQGAGLRAYRRLARKLADAELDPQLLYRAARADHFGRTTADALARDFSAGEEFITTMERLGEEEVVGQDVVLGRHLIARGLEPGPVFGEILARCRDVQDDTGWDDPERILETVLPADRDGSD